MDGIIDPGISRELPGRIFMYPCAGRDWAQPLQAFAGHMDEFRFVDIHYQFRAPEPILVDSLSLVRATTTLSGPVDARMLWLRDASGRSYRDIQPGWLSEHYLHRVSGRTVQIIRRRGFGQYALHELPDASLGVFYHRGDSAGEGGSNSWFLANKKYRHPVLSMLFDVSFPRNFVFQG